MASLAAQIIDQRINGIVERHADAFAAELGLGAGDDPRRRSAAFTFLAARTVLDLTDDEALDCIVDGGDDFGVDALSFGEPEGGAVPVVLIQSKYRRRLDGAAAFPENGIARMIDAVGTLFDPGRQVAVNERLRHRIEEIRSFVADGAIPSITAVAANNGARWTPQAQQRIDRAAEDFGDQVEWRQRPHQARFRSREHFGILYDTIFTSELNGAQAVVAALALRLAENRRKRPPRENAPDFLPYGSRFAAMRVGWSLLGDMGLKTPGELDHRNFGRALELLEQAPKRRLRRAEREIAAALKPLFHRRERTLQRLSAAFRRADLVEMLMSRASGGP